MLITTTNEYGEGKTQRMENTYKDDTMAITMNGHGELDKNWKRKYEMYDENMIY
jgi:hypothetical protein